ncbi:MAG: SOS cell division inhibitor [Marinobacter sp.]|nr:SOS cell division inhibitor [Marinobacter sp.]
MTESPNDLQVLDQLIGCLAQALSDKDWDRLSELNQQVKTTVAPVMARLEAGEVAVEPVRERLERIQAFCDEASERAAEARKEAEQALKGVNRNRNAARTYQNVSGNDSK